MAENRMGLKTKMELKKIEGTFAIRETNGDAMMKNIRASALPRLHGLTSEDPDTILFEFVVI